MFCRRCDDEVMTLYMVGQDLVCKRCKDGEKRCGKCRRSFRKDAPGAKVYTQKSKGWYCWHCLSGDSKYNGFGTGVFDSKPEPEHKWQICTVDFEEVTDDSDLKFVKAFEETSPTTEGEIVKTIRSFLRMCVESRWYEIHRDAAHDFQMGCTPTLLAKEAKRIGLTSYAYSDWPEVKVYGGGKEAHAKGHLVTLHGGRIPLEFLLVIEDDWPEGPHWKVAAVGEY